MEMKHYVLIKDKEGVDNSKHMCSLNIDYVTERCSLNLICMFIYRQHQLFVQYQASLLCFIFAVFVITTIV